MDDLDQGHLRHRIEKVQADEAAGPGEPRPQALEHQAGRVGREDGVRLHARFKRGVKRPLRLRLLDDRLDDEVRAQHTVAAEIRLQALAGGGRLGRVLEALPERHAGALERAVDEALLAILQRDLEPADRAPGGDVATHDAGAHDVHPLDAGRHAAERLQAVLQEKHPDQVLRGRRDEECGHRAGLGVVGHLAVRPVASPEVEHRVRRGVMVGPGPRLDGLAHPADHERPNRREREQPVDERRTPAGRAVRDEAAGLGLEAARRDHRVDEPHLQCLVGADRPPGQHQVERPTHADETRRAHRAAKPRVDAELNLGQAERDAAVVGGDAVAAGERELEATAEGKAVDQGDRRDRQRLEACDDRLARPHEVVAFRRGGELGEFGDVGAGNEAVLLARAKHEPAQGPALDLVERAGEILEHRPRQGVGRRADLVERQPAHVVVVHAQGPVGRLVRRVGRCHHVILRKGPGAGALKSEGREPAPRALRPAAGYAALTAQSALTVKSQTSGR